jgi:hypothetical protein
MIKFTNLTFLQHFFQSSLLKASMPGNFFPSRYSKEAPPPVEMWLRNSTSSFFGHSKLEFGAYLEFGILDFIIKLRCLQCLDCTPLESDEVRRLP